VTFQFGLANRPNQLRQKTGLSLAALQKIYSYMYLISSYLSPWRQVRVAHAAGSTRLTVRSWRRRHLIQPTLSSLLFTKQPLEPVPLHCPHNGRVSYRHTRCRYLRPLDYRRSMRILQHLLTRSSSEHPTFPVSIDATTCLNGSVYIRLTMESDNGTR